MRRHHQLREFSKKHNWIASDKSFDLYNYFGTTDKLHIIFTLWVYCRIVVLKFQLCAKRSSVVLKGQRQILIHVSMYEAVWCFWLQCYKCFCKIFRKNFSGFVYRATWIFSVLKGDSIKGAIIRKGNLVNSYKLNFFSPKLTVSLNEKSSCLFSLLFKKCYSFFFFDWSIILA